LHVLTHAVMKSCLFLIAGGIYESTGIREVPRFAGLSRRMPITAVAFTVAALSMVGVPPTAGFFSKWYLVLGALDEGSLLLAVVIVASSLLTLWYVLRVMESVFSSSAAIDPALAEASEPGRGVLTPVLILAVGVVAVGVGNAVIVDQVLDPIVVTLLGTAPPPG
jgi:multicomponent Na+:H+ antiporter subunit D